MNKLTCPQCKKEIELQKSKKDIFFYFCKDCNIGGKGANETEAKRNFLKAYEQQKNSMSLLLPPKSKNDIPAWVQNNLNIILQQSAQFIDKPATKRLIEKNVKYLMSAELKDAWNNPEGIQSVIDAFMEAMYMGASLPEMGAIVPFGKINTIVEFIPAVSAFEFALTSGENPPFKNISIDCIYERDNYEIEREDGQFKNKLKPALPRGEVVGVVVQAFDIERNCMIGELYDADRLLEKAMRHSVSYKYYLNDLQLLREAQAEKKNYIMKGDKKIYENDIKNPYDGADRPEMLKKVAGKSFFRPYMKIRNARAVAKEWGNDFEQKSYDKTIIDTLDVSINNMKIEDAEFSIDDDENNSSEDNKTLFKE